MMGLLDFAAKYLPEVNEWKMAKEQRGPQVERNWLGMLHPRSITETPIPENHYITTKRKTKKIGKRTNVAKKQIASMQAHVKRLTEASLTKNVCQNEKPQCKCCHKPSNNPTNKNTYVKKNFENDWERDVSKLLKPTSRKDNRNKNVKSQIIQTMESSSLNDVVTIIDSEIKTFKEKKEEFINYLEVLQSEIKALELPYDEKHSKALTALHDLEISKDNVEDDSAVITMEVLKEDSKPNITEVLEETIENTTEINEELENKKQVKNTEPELKENVKEIKNEESTNSKSSEDNNKKTKSPKKTKKSVKKDSETLKKKVDKKNKNKNKEASDETKNLLAEEAELNDMLRASFFKSMKILDDKEIDKIRKKLQKSKTEKQGKNSSCLRRINTLVSDSFTSNSNVNKTFLEKNTFNPKNLDEDMLNFIIPKLKSLANRGPNFPAKSANLQFRLR